MSEQQNERYRRARALFHAAGDLEPAARDAYLATACRGDPSLAREVAALLAAADTPTERVLPPAGAVPAPATAPGAAPESVGGERRWLLVRELGRGGMGTVYLAERADGEFRQQAALKLVRGRGSASFLDRLRAERQILADLDHPHIARLLDGGSTADGEPFLVMEWVDGVPIDRYAEDQELNVDGRLRILARVADAVHHAHQNLVVHRDLKPSNILVTDAGAPKLLDFGIASLLGPDTGGRGLPASLAMTPSWASPEQVAGAAITTASDVYQLGLLLDRLLTGGSPYRPADDTPSALLDAIAGQPPMPPSVRAARNGDARHARRLHGDLDAIVLHALAKRPEDRYASAAELADDLRRHLAHQPVRARAGGALYRAYSWLRRNRLLAAAGAIIVVLLTAFAAVSRLQAEREGRERERAEQVVVGLVSMFETSDPNAAAVEDQDARGYLEHGLEVAAGLDDARVRASLEHELGRIFTNLGDYARGAEILAEAAEQRRRLLGPEHPEVAASLYELGRASIYNYDHEAAEAALEEALAIHRARLGDHPFTAQTLSALGLLMVEKAELDEAERFLRQALAIQKRVLPADHIDLSSTLSNLGEVQQDRGALEAAIASHQRALDIRRRKLGSDHPLVAESANNTGIALKKAGRYTEAETLLREALAGYRRRFGDRHQLAAIAASNLSNLLLERGELAEAERLSRQAVDVFVATTGEDSVDASIARNGLAKILQRTDPAAAEPLYRRAIADLERALGPEHPIPAIARHNLATALRDLGRLDAADEALAAAEVVLRAAYGDNNRRIASSLHERAALERLHGDDVRAEALYRQALDLRIAHLAPGHFALAATRADLGTLLLDHGRVAEALALLEAANAVHAAELRVDDPRRLASAAALRRAR